MKKRMKQVVALLMATTMVIGTTACGSSKDSAKESPLDPKNPTTISIWNYYNGDQLTAFDDLVEEFNSTVGVDEGIIVESTSQSDINTLADTLLDAADGKVGSEDLPTMASIYAETAYILNQKDLLANLDDYFTKDELSAYIPGFIEEGRMIDQGELLLFPVSKSTECFAVNKTDWADFEAKTGIAISDIQTYEDLTSAAKEYYDYTDALTPNVTDDGKALYGRDSVANYVYIGTTELGHEMFTVSEDGVKVDFDKDTFKTLWDNYYIPYINGYFASNADYRSEDMKTGTILALTGSTSAVGYLPTAVVNENDESHDIELQIEKSFSFKDGNDTAVQQGAGYCVLKGTESEQYAACEFLKWFTDAERNLQFSITSGYSPVTIAANTTDKIESAMKTQEDSIKETNIKNALLISADVYTNQDTYTCKPFEGSKDVRFLLQDALEKTAVNDRAAIVEAMKNGMSRVDAVAQYSTDEYFNTWFNGLSEEVNKTVK